MYSVCSAYKKKRMVAGYTQRYKICTTICINGKRHASLQKKKRKKVRLLLTENKIDKIHSLPFYHQIPVIALLAPLSFDHGN